jgi:SAM-dependent methyltransferase
MARQVSDTWERGDPYERYVGRWSRQVAPRFLDWLAIPAGKRWLDVGCGTGALAAAILDRCAPAAIAAVEPSAGFRETAQRNLAGRATVQAGSAGELPLADRSADVVVSGLVLNFIPDLPAALREMARVAADGGVLAGYVWDYAGRMQLMRAFWDAAVEADGNAAALDEGRRFPLCRPEALQRAFSDAGLGGSTVAPIDIPTVFASFDDYWQPFLGGQGPAPAYAMSLDEAARARLRERVRASLPVGADGSIELVARAWAVRAKVREPQQSP